METKVSAKASAKASVMNTICRFDYVPDEILYLIVSHTSINIASLLYSVSKQFHKSLKEDTIWDTITQRSGFVLTSTLAITLINSGNYKAFCAVVRHLDQQQMYELRPKIINKCTTKCPTSLCHINALVYITTRDRENDSGNLLDENLNKVKVKLQNRKILCDTPSTFSLGTRLYDKLNPVALHALLQSIILTTNGSVLSKLKILYHTVNISCLRGGVYYSAVMRSFNSVVNVVTSCNLSHYTSDTTPAEFFTGQVVSNLCRGVTSVRFHQIMGCPQFRELILQSDVALKYLAQTCSKNNNFAGRIKPYSDVHKAIQVYKQTFNLAATNSLSEETTDNNSDKSRVSGSSSSEEAPKKTIKYKRAVKATAKARYVSSNSSSEKSEDNISVDARPEESEEDKMNSNSSKSRVSGSSSSEEIPKKVMKTAKACCKLSTSSSEECVPVKRVTSTKVKYSVDTEESEDNTDMHTLSEESEDDRSPSPQPKMRNKFIHRTINRKSKAATKKVVVRKPKIPRTKIIQDVNTANKDELVDCFKRFIDTAGSDTSIMFLVAGGYYTVEWLSGDESCEHRMFLSQFNLAAIKNQILGSPSNGNTLAEYISDIVAVPIHSLRFSRILNGTAVYL